MASILRRAQHAGQHEPPRKRIWQRRNGIVFASLNRERVRRQIYRTIAEARADILDYFEVFCNRTHRHVHLGGMLSVEFEEKKLVA